MIKVKDGYAKLIGTTYLGSADRVLLSNGGDIEKAVASTAHTLVLRNASGLINSSGFIRTSSSNDYVLLGGGSHCKLTSLDLLTWTSYDTCNLDGDVKKYNWYKIPRPTASRDYNIYDIQVISDTNYPSIAYYKLWVSNYNATEETNVYLQNLGRGGYPTYDSSEIMLHLYICNDAEGNVYILGVGIFISKMYIKTLKGDIISNTVVGYDIPGVANGFTPDTPIYKDSIAYKGKTIVYDLNKYPHIVTNIYGNAFRKDGNPLVLESSASLYLKSAGSDAASIHLNSVHFKPFDTANGKLNLGTASARWLGIYALTGDFSGLITTAGLTTSDSIVLSGTTAETSLILFTRTNYNYITFPTGYSLAFGVGVGSVNTLYRMTDNAFFPETTNVKTLGTSSLKWSTVYATTFSGNLTGTASNADTLDGIHANGLLTALSSNTTNKVSLTVGGTTKNITTLYASYLCSVGIVNPQTGRTLAYGNVYSYNTSGSAHEGAPTTFTSVIGFGRGTLGTVEICGSWFAGRGLWVRALRDTTDDWYAWDRILTEATYQTVLDSRYYTETEVNNLLKNYLPLTGGTMQLGEGLKFHADNNYFGTYADARIISLLDNGTICDGGLIIDSRGTSDGVEHVIELLRIRPGEFKWKGLDILHSGNYSSYLGYIGTTPVQASSAALALTGITNITMTGNLSTSGNIYATTFTGTATLVKCTASTDNKDRPIVLTGTSNDLYYTTKATINYSTGNIITSGSIFAIGGRINTSTNTTPLVIARGSDIRESISIGVEDRIAYFHYQNDEDRNEIRFVLSNAGGNNVANTSTISFKGNSSGSTVTATKFVGAFSGNLSGTASNADVVDGYHISVVGSLPSSTNSSTIYFVTS